MDRRLSGILNVWDENFIHCYTVNNNNIQDEFILDWFDSAYHDTSGIYTSVDAYYLRYRAPAKQYKNTPVYADCSKPSNAWVADFSKFDFLFDPVRKDPPVNR